MAPAELSFVIPVYNGGSTIAEVVNRIRECCAPQSPGLTTGCIQIVLVNDGSSDNSEEVGLRLARSFPDQVVFLSLTRNFGEHNAVLAGVKHSNGRYVAVLDDDGQHPPEEVLRMLSCLKDRSLDVVYGRYRVKQHNWFRNLGSRFNDRLATWLLKKPRELYLSSFKVMTRELADQLVQYTGPFPYVDGLIFRVTRRIGQIDVEHRPRIAGASGYTLRRLIRLWLNMLLGFSVTPLRIPVLLGLFTSLGSFLLLIAIVIDKLWINPELAPGIPTILVLITFFSGVQLTVLGAVGEYVGRILLELNGMPQYVVRHTGLRDELPEPPR